MPQSEWVLWNQWIQGKDNSVIVNTKMQSSLFSKTDEYGKFGTHVLKFLAMFLENIIQVCTK